MSVKAKVRYSRDFNVPNGRDVRDICKVYRDVRDVYRDLRDIRDV